MARLFVGSFGRVLVSLYVLLLVGGWCVSGWADDPVAVTNSVSTQQIQIWIDQLGSDRFDVREVASQKLRDTGDKAITALVRGTQSGNIEQRIRSLDVLRELAIRDDTGASAAETAIADIASRKGTTIAQQALFLKQSLQEIRSVRARQILSRLGARIGLIEDLDEQSVLDTRVPMVTFDKDWRGKPEDVKVINWLQKDVKIRLRGPKFSDEYLSKIVELDNVIALEFNRTQITDAAMSRIASLKKLRALQIRYCDLLTNRSLKQIERVGDSLLLLKIFDKQFTRPAFDQLTQKFPACRTRFGRGGFLGIGGLANPTGGRGCLVSRISPNGAAEKAGIREGDLILTYDGKEVDRFSERDDVDPENPRPETTPLSELIAKNLHGDKVVVTVQRPGRPEPLELKVTLGSWD